MANPARGELRKTSEGYTARITLRGKERKTFTLPTCRDDDEAQTRADLLAKLARDFRKAKVLDTPDAPKLLDMAASATPALLAGVVQVARELVGGELPDKTKDRTSTTFADVAGDWTSGKLNERWPDHVRAKRTVGDDKVRLATLCKAIGDVPIVAFTVTDADRAMATLPAGLASVTRRHYAQLITRVMRMSVYPLQLVQASPIPPGWLPRAKSRVRPYLYPGEDAAIMACEAIPFTIRVLYGFLAREGMRKGEALTLRWGDVDTARGSVMLDENKTDDPRAWALSPGVTKALLAYKKQCKDTEAGDLVFPLGELRADDFRSWLAVAGVKRPELTASTATRKPADIHSLRATFVTLSLASGRSETWVADRTGHKSSTMINRYRQQARTASELGLGELAPLDAALGLRGDDCPAIAPFRGGPRTGKKKRRPQLSGSAGESNSPGPGIHQTPIGFEDRGPHQRTKRFRVEA